MHCPSAGLNYATVGSASFMSPPPCNGTTFFCQCLLGAFLSKILTKFELLDCTVRYCVARSQRPTTTSISGPDQPRFHVQIDLNFTSNSTSISRPIRSQFYVQFDFNFTSTLKPMEHVFLPTVRSWGDMKLPLATVL